MQQHRPQNSGISKRTPPWRADSWAITPGRHKSMDRASSKGGGVSVATLSIDPPPFVMPSVMWNLGPVTQFWAGAPPLREAVQ